MDPLILFSYASRAAGCRSSVGLKDQLDREGQRITELEAYGVIQYNEDGNQGETTRNDLSDKRGEDYVVDVGCLLMVNA